MSNLNVILNGAVAQVVNSVDSTTRVNSSVGNPTLNCKDSRYYYFLGVSNISSSIPILQPSYVVYVRNLGGIGGTPSGNITVRVQVVGGSLQAAIDSPIIPPGGVWMYWCTNESAGGISAVTLVASVDQTPVEFLSAGG